MKASENERIEKVTDYIKKAKVISFITSLFDDSIFIILDKKIKINNKKYKRILLVSDLLDLQERWDRIKKAKNFPFNLEKENLKTFLNINNSIILELLN